MSHREEFDPTEKVEGFDFTEGEYAASDPRFETEEVEYAYTSMTNMAFITTHDHDSQSITVIQRYTKQLVNEDGFSEPKPQQVSFTVPLSHMRHVMEMMMEESMCLVEVNRRNES